MKDATGELSMTAVAVVAIGAIALLFSTVVWPRIQATIERNTNCANAYNCTDCNDGVCTCNYLAEDGQTVNTVQCAMSTNDN